MTGLDAWRQRYLSLGLCAIPLHTGSKQPVCVDWTGTLPPVQWQQAGTRAGNIGIRTGNKFSVADADSPQTAQALHHKLTGLGVKPPIVRTQSGGTHYWLLIADVPLGENFRLWNPDLGKGELRVGPGAQVVAPCSAVNGKRYRFMPGTAPEHLLNMRALRWRDLLPLIRPTQTQALDALPIPFPRREMASWARWLLQVLHGWPQGEQVKRSLASLQGVPRKDADGNTLVTWYTSRSEAEQAIVLHAVWCGWNFSEVATLFEEYQPGHYAAQHDTERYLRTCWRNALGYLASTPERIAIAKLWQWAEERAWPGRGGGNERMAYRALLQRAWLANTLEPDVSRRDVQLHASMGSTGARNALQRLVSQDIVAQAGRRQYATAARTWQLKPDVADAEPVNLTAPVQNVDALPGGAELWAVLGHAAGMVFARLNGEPKNATALAAATGKHRSTVYRVLEQLARHELAVDTGNGWVVGERDAAEVAHEVGAVTAKKRREITIEHERLTFREQLAERCA